MPRYAYKCHNDHKYEEERSIHADDTVDKCVECGEKLVRDYSELGSTMRIRVKQTRGEKYD